VKDENGGKTSTSGQTKQERGGKALMSRKGDWKGETIKIGKDRKELRKPGKHS